MTTMLFSKYRKINSQSFALALVYLIAALILLKFSLYPSLFSYDANFHVLSADYIIANNQLPASDSPFSVGHSILPLFNSFLAIIGIVTNVSTFHLAKYVVPLLQYTVIFLFAYLILRNIDNKNYSFWLVILVLFFSFVSIKSLRFFAQAVRPEILGVSLILAFKYSYIKFIKKDELKYILIALVFGICTILIHYLASLFLVAPFLIYGLFFGNKRVKFSRLLNEKVVALLLFTVFWAVAILGGGRIYSDIGYILGFNRSNQLIKISVLLIPIFGLVLISKIVPVITRILSPMLRFINNFLQRYQTFLAPLLIAILFVAFLKVSAISDYKLFFAYNIHWIVFIPLSALFFFTYITSKGKDNRLSFLLCFLAFSYVFSVLVLFIVYSGVAKGYYGSAWVLRLINYVFLELVLFGFLFAREVGKPNSWETSKIKKYVKVFTLTFLLLGTILITVYYVDDTGNKPEMYTSALMLSAEGYVYNNLKPSCLAGSSPFIYPGINFSKKSEFEYVEFPSDIKGFIEYDQRNCEIAFIVNKHQMDKYDRFYASSSINNEYLSQIEQYSSLNKIYSNNWVFVSE